jgi:hypothetical protein
VKGISVGGGGGGRRRRLGGQGTTERVPPEPLVPPDSFSIEKTTWKSLLDPDFHTQRCGILIFHRWGNTGSF